MKHAAIFFALFALVLSDMYLHNPRGSNNRLNEANANRNNANRLFDSQNNAKGGYCWGPTMTYYERSLLMVEWTVQHGCGANPKLVCNIVLQYMCGEAGAAPVNLIRDGQTTNTITNDANGATATQGNDLLYGMHENYLYYQNCDRRNRNMGLWIADREEEGGLTPGRADARFTRQNNNANRHGYECAEERDYYPYWHPNPWKDIVILTHSEEYCDFYTAESHNVKGKNYCRDPATPEVHAAPNNEAECTSDGLEWAEEEAHGIPAPDCIHAPWSSDNHLGHGLQTPGAMNNYNWTVPDWEPCADTEAGCNCVMRIRYNISTAELGMEAMSRPDTGFIDWTSNNQIIHEDELVNIDSETTMELAIDTTQFGRTFEDRSHVFRIAKRPQGVPRLARIFNLNVRGKRGNIVQAYPSVEYDFIPVHLYARVGDYVHFQWTGCDTNPAGNAGEGTDGTDRSNCVQIPHSESTYPITDEWARQNKRKVLFEDEGLRRRMANLDQTGCLSREELEALNVNADQDVRFCAKLNAASRYFNGGVLRMNKTGSFHYMSTRNHSFTNRDQKGTITVTPLLPSWALGIVIVGAILSVGAGGVAFMMFYAKNNPHSGVANVFSKM